jgi:hypothetical protein
LGLYERASSKISVNVSRSPAAEGADLVLSRPDSVEVVSGSFREVISPVAQVPINAALRRLSAPNRLVLNLMGDGEKSVLDSSPMGLSLWAESLQNSKIYLKDCVWAGEALPPEAWAAHALILAGPRRPLGEERERALMDYLEKGGKLLALQDPMVVGLSQGALAPLGLDLPWGLLVAPDATWAGTEDFFIVSRDFPAHPITAGLSQPVVWPLAGAVAATPAAGGGQAGQGESGPGGPGEAGPEEGEPLSHTWVLALTSDAAWLETDRASLAGRSHRYQAGADLPGPLALASATSIAGGGRLALAADADLAANAFIAYAGNLAFLDNMLYWLLGAQEELPAPPAIAWLDLTHAKARALFWIPVVLWPLAVVLAWGRCYLGRRRRAG